MLDQAVGVDAEVRVQRRSSGGDHAAKSCGHTQFAAGRDQEVEVAARSACSTLRMKKQRNRA